MSFKYLITGSAGFIGSALTIRLLERGDIVIGIDNHNNYYDPVIKQARLDRFSEHPNYTHFVSTLLIEKRLRRFLMNTNHSVWSTLQHKQVCVTPSRIRC